jgi:lactate 2-monooxygenase
MTSSGAPGAPGSVGRAVQGAIYRDGALGRRPRVPVSDIGLERAARRAMGRRAWAYVAGSAGREVTVEANRRALDAWALVPRMLRDVAQRDLSVELLGRRRPTPFVLSPIGVLEMAHRGSDRAVARAAAGLGVPLVVSTQASTPMEAVAAAAPSGEQWFQLYWSNRDDLVVSFVERAERAGCTALVVTLDTHVLGWRPRDLDLGSLPFARGLGIAQYTSDPVFSRLVDERLAADPGPAAPSPRPRPGALATLASLARAHPGRTSENLRSRRPRVAVETFLDVFSRSSLTWDDLAFVRSRTRLPLVLKGIQHPDDASRAVDCGADAVWVSNHGGRQVDGAMGSLAALPGVVERLAGRLPVVFDSGVRGGADAAIALALGADLVGVGRPYVHGLAVDGERGVVDVVSRLVAELDLTMALVGATTVAELTPDLLVRR